MHLCSSFLSAMREQFSTPNWQFYVYTLKSLSESLWNQAQAVNRFIDHLKCIMDLQDLFVVPAHIADRGLKHKHRATETTSRSRVAVSRILVMEYRH